MMLSKIERVTREAIKNKASVQVHNPDSPEEFSQYCKIKDQDCEKAYDWLLSKIAKRQIEKVSTSSRIKKDKKERVIEFWRKYEEFTL